MNERPKLLLSWSSGKDSDWAHLQSICGMAFSPDGNWLVASDATGLVRPWDGEPSRRIASTTETTPGTGCTRTGGASSAHAGTPQT